MIDQAELQACRVSDGLFRRSTAKGCLSGCRPDFGSLALI
ncbi:MAG: hypothetical protein RL751_2002 [Bacteroidota bacterium]